MNRAMFSGVAGLKTHQTKMDVIGNNIANVNTFGFKSQRAVFSDVYYQTLKSASAGTTSRGGTNPSTVGYGSSLAAVQTQMSQSSMQNTGFGMDVAIMGEGFLQVMDPDGNIFYTKAGLLDYDSNGYLTDINGNFVLGSTTSDGKPGTQKIRLDNIGSVDAAKPSVTETINGVEYTISTSNTTPYGNVGLSIGSSEKLPAGMKAVATISSTGSVSVQLNAYEEFSSMSDLNSAINAAIKEANGGKEHPAGTFTISANKNLFGKDQVDGSFTGAATAKGAELVPGAGFFGGKLGIGKFTPDAATVGTATAFTVVADGAGAYDVTATVGGVAYTGKISTATAFPMTLTSPGGGSIELVQKGTEGLSAVDLAAAAATPPTATMTPAEYFLGGAEISKMSPNFAAAGKMDFTVTGVNADGSYTIEAKVGGKAYTGTATPGGEVDLATADPLDGTITMKFPTLDDMKKNLGLPASASTTDIQTALQASQTKHGYRAIAQTGAINTPLTGAQIAGTNFGTVGGSITGGNVEDGFFGGAMTIMKTSNNFSGSGTVKMSDFTAEYTEAAGTDPAKWTVTMNVGGKAYTATIDEKTKASSLLLKGPDGDYIQVGNPGFDGMTQEYKNQNPGTNPVTGSSMQARAGTDELTVAPATPSQDLGLGSTGFTLEGGTEGGAITLDELSSIAIGSDGTISVSHPEKGVVVAGKISLANFSNPSGLQSQGSNYFSASVNSGEPVLCDPGSDGTGILKSGALEMSNVDLSAEFADMITTQRGFQANSRIITVSDTMLEELINLKR